MPPKVPTRVAMIGCGGMARHHIEDILQQQKTTTITAMCEPSPAAYELAADLFDQAGLRVPPNQPDLEKLLQEAGGRRLADGDRSGDADDEGCPRGVDREERVGRTVEVPGVSPVQVEQLGEGDVDLRHVQVTRRVAEAAQSRQRLVVEIDVGVVGEVRPLAARQFDVGAGLQCRHDVHHSASASALRRLTRNWVTVCDICGIPTPV